MFEINKAQKEFNKGFLELLEIQKKYSESLKQVRASVNALYHCYLDNTNHSARSGDWLMQVQNASQVIADEVKYLDRYQQRLQLIQEQLMSESDKTA